MRREIQGLRAIAVSLVLLFHLWPNRLPGGYVGVDVFFVISGFLITSHLLREADRTGSVALADFWARRARRLLPASYLVLAVSAIAVIVWVPSMMWQQFFKEIGAAALYVENWTLAADSVDYLAADNAPSPAQHYWTLSAEEQFYLIWPLLVLAGIWLASRRASRSRVPRGLVERRRVALVLGIVTAASLVFSLVYTTANPAASYFITPTRAWEFGAGAMLAFLPAVRWPAGWRAVGSWVGLGVVVSCAFLLSESTPMPGTAAVVVVAATALVIWCEEPPVAWSPVRPLTARPVQYLGDVSYAVYLWHWPLIIIVPYALGSDLGTLDKIAIGAATFALAAASKRFVEDPFRTTTRFGMRRASRTFLATGVGAALVVSLCGWGWQTVETRNREEDARAAALVADAPPCFGAAERDPRQEDCPNPDLAGTLVPSPAAVADDYPDYRECDAQMKRDPLVGCTFGKPSDDRPHIAVIGDSHARALMPAIEELVDDGILTADLFTMGGCTWATGKPYIRTNAELRRDCIAYKERLQPLLERTATAYDFILTTSWASNMGGSEEKRIRSLVDAWKPVARQGVPIVALRDNPQSGRDPATNPNGCLAEVDVADANAECALSRAEALDGVFDPYGPAVKRTPGAHYLDLSSFYCDDETCPVVVGGVNVYRDNSHVSVTYTRTMAPYYYRALVAEGLLRAR